MNLAQLQGLPIEQALEIFRRTRDLKLFRAAFGSDGLEVFIALAAAQEEPPQGARR